jgi:putative ABC transport system ATP-binding protein
MILQTKDLTKVYRVGKEEVPALRGVNFELDVGEFVVINGPSGSGKTTFLNLIACIDKPTSGEVFIEGQPTSQLSEGQLAELRKRKIGLVFQTFNLIPVLSAFENVEYPLLLLGIGRAERRRRVMALLEEVGLKDLANRRPDELSGGQRQRVCYRPCARHQSQISSRRRAHGELGLRDGQTSHGHYEAAQRGASRRVLSRHP